MPALPRSQPGTPLPREALAVDVLDAARALLGSVLRAETDDGAVAVRLVEVEAYRGADDPASHSYRGRTARNAVMWGPPGHLYVYFVYGMHHCANVVCLTDGVPGAVLLRAGEVVHGLEAARRRRPGARGDHELAMGPGRLARLLALDRSRNGVDLTDPDSPVRLLAGEPVAASAIRAGPRVGVAAAAERPWRFWLLGSDAVSPYRRGGRASRRRTVDIGAAAKHGAADNGAAAEQGAADNSAAVEGGAAAAGTAENGAAKPANSLGAVGEDLPPWQSTSSTS